MSAETKWTKGTWALVIRPRGPDEIRSSDERAELICEFPFGASDGSELEANARLIAAAPELLEALRELSAAYKWMMNECEFAEQRLADDRFEAALESAGAAIARATGATP